MGDIPTALRRGLSKQIVAFDVFDQFPETEWELDKPARARFIEGAGSQSISIDDLRTVLERKDIGANVELVKGNIVETLPAYIDAHPELAVSLVNLDADVYEPAVTALRCLWPRLVPGGILIVDDFSVFPGETAAIREYFGDHLPKVQKLPFNKTPSFIVK